MEWCDRFPRPRSAFSKTALFVGTSVTLVGGVGASMYGFSKLLDACDRSKKVAIGCNLACLIGGGVVTTCMAGGAYEYLRHDLKASKNMCQFIGRSALVAGCGMTTLVPLGITVLAGLAFKENVSSLIENNRSSSSHAYRPPPC